jgi:hypothetical protein
MNSRRFMSDLKLWKQHRIGLIEYFDRGQFTQATVPTLIDENDPVWRRMDAKGYQRLASQSPELMPDVWRENEGHPGRELNLILIPVDPRLSNSLKHRDGLQIGVRVQRGFISRWRSLNAEPYWR